MRSAVVGRLLCSDSFELSFLPLEIFKISFMPLFSFPLLLFRISFFYKGNQGIPVNFLKTSGNLIISQLFPVELINPIFI